MTANSKIEWCHHTFNPWWGCQRVSPGCEHCYAETFSKRLGLKIWGPESAGTPRRFFGDKHWAEPLRWNKRAAELGERHRVFCASMADVFEDRADLAAPRARLFALTRETPQLDWLLLTKRPENIDRLWREAAIEAFNGADSFGPNFGNVWLGCTAEDQRRADERIPRLLACHPLASKIFVSYEPALESVDFSSWMPEWRCSAGCDAGTFALDHGRRSMVCSDCGAPKIDGDGIDWIIVGGESGLGAREMREEWVLSIRDQCAAAGVPFFFKQWGGIRKKVRGRVLQGRTHDAFPVVAP